MGKRCIWHEKPPCFWETPNDCYYSISGEDIDYWTEAKFHKEEGREHWKTTKRRAVPDVKNQQAINRMTKEILVRIMRMVIQSIKSQS